ncbi:MAG TPA: histidine--tRNA ligase [Steroidobacteraceae bacterium]|nr:histidine--tRNA ligase [Steroidobacteraceae bacterium]
MTETIEPLRGMNDVLPEEARWWQRVETAARGVFARYGYREIRVPLLERTGLFKRAIGEQTDIVEKEMFTFDDRDGDSLTLRPEATAGIVRAAISNGMLHNQRHRVFTLGPMFRGERPQKGRYRQFHQIDAEAFGYDGPDVDAELILLSARLWRELGISRVRLELNSLGTDAARGAYREALRTYFTAHAAELDPDSRRRLTGNPLRILDSKNPALEALIGAAPVLGDYLDEPSREHFAGLKARLEAAGVPYIVNPRLVRGLDYYSRTVFEWTTDALGSQNAICSGGRYDGLVGQLGGAPTPAIGWAAGIERIVLLMQELGLTAAAEVPHAYCVLAGPQAAEQGLALAERMRDELPWVRLETDLGGGSFKAQFKRADKSGAEVAIVIGEDELARGVAALKPLRGEGGQQECPLGELPARLAQLLGRSRPADAAGSGRDERGS